MNVVQIEKEQVSFLNFPKTDVLETINEQKVRRATLRRASILGNLDRTKMRILFKDDEGFKKINTTVWAVTPNYVILKGARLLPLNRIVKVY